MCVWAELCKVVKSDFYIVCVADSCIVRLVDVSRNTSGEFLEISEVELESRGFARFRSCCVLQHAHSMRIRLCDTEKKKAGYDRKRAKGDTETLAKGLKKRNE